VSGFRVDGGTEAGLWNVQFGFWYVGTWDCPNTKSAAGSAGCGEIPVMLARSAYAKVEAVGNRSWLDIAVNEKLMWSGSAKLL